jgi:hypothetical protein
MKGGRILGILISLAFIIGGLSGKLVLRGTGSSIALVVVGAIYLAIEIIGAINDAKEEEAQSQAPSPAPVQNLVVTKVINPDEWKEYFRNTLLKNFPQYILKENVPVTELTGDVHDVFKLYKERPNQVYKAEWGKPYDFVLYSGDTPKAVVMLGTGNVHQSKVVYLISKMFAKKLKVPYLGFYLQFPNEESYVVKRVREALAE